MTLLSLQSVTAGYGSLPVLKDVSLEMEKGQILALVGESGSGKSTVMKSIAGLPSFGVSVMKGSIRFDGKDMIALSPEQRRRILGEDLCMIFQNPTTSMNRIRKIRNQFLESYRSHRNGGDEEALQQVRTTFQKLGLADTDRILDSCPFELSGGMCQRVAIALAMVMEPKLLLADEPTSALDVVSQQQVLEEMLLLRERFGTSVLLVTHNIAAAARVADRLVILHDGCIEEAGAKDALIASPQKEYTKLLLNNVPRLCRTERRREKTEVLLQVSGIEKTYLKNGVRVRAVENVSLALEKGEILGIVGESGSGKSTLARQILRLEKPSRGQITVCGKDIARLKKKDVKGLYQAEQIIFQNPETSFNPRMRIRESIRDTLRNLAGIRSKPQIEEKIDELMRDVGLAPELANRYPFQLSGGQCQRAAIARALAASPQLLICDEATSALDVTVQAGIVSLLRSLARGRGMSMIFISHDLAPVSTLCDRVVVMKDGRCIEQGTAADIVAHPKQEYTKLLLRSASFR